MRTIFRDIAYIYMIKHYDVIDKKAREYPVVIGGGWKPGWSTDYCATILAEDYQIGTIVNLSNIDRVYTKDPNKFKDAKPIDKMNWDEVISLVGDKWSPGLNVPFDPIASRKAKEIGLKVIICNGKNLDNLNQILNGETFIGTVIE